MRGDWASVSAAPYEWAGNTYTQRFAIMTNGPAYFYEIRGQ